MVNDKYDTIIICSIKKYILRNKEIVLGLASNRYIINVHTRKLRSISLIKLSLVSISSFKCKIALSIYIGAIIFKWCGQSLISLGRRYDLWKSERKQLKSIDSFSPNFWNGPCFPDDARTHTSQVQLSPKLH